MTPVTPVKEEVMMEEEKEDKGDEGEASGRGMTITPVREGAPNPRLQSRLRWWGGRWFISTSAPSVKLLRCRKGGWTATLGRSIH